MKKQCISQCYGYDDVDGAKINPSDSLLIARC